MSKVAESEKGGRYFDYGADLARKRHGNGTFPQIKSGKNILWLCGFLLTI